VTLPQPKDSGKSLLLLSEEGEREKKGQYWQLGGLLYQRGELRAWCRQLAGSPLRRESDRPPSVWFLLVARFSQLVSTSPNPPPPAPAAAAAAAAAAAMMVMLSLSLSLRVASDPGEQLATTLLELGDRVVSS
jgi:hypothetical protein